MPGKLLSITWQQVRLAQQMRRQLEQQQMRQQLALERPQVLEQQAQALLLFCRKRTKQQQR
jgi:hypothetical protein